MGDFMREGEEATGEGRETGVESNRGFVCADRERGVDTVGDTETL